MTPEEYFTAQLERQAVGSRSTERIMGLHVPDMCLDEAMRIERQRMRDSDKCPVCSKPKGHSVMYCSGQCRNRARINRNLSMQGNHHCDICGQGLPTERGLSGHYRTVHGIIERMGHGRN